MRYGPTKVLRLSLRTGRAEVCDQAHYLVLDTQHQEVLGTEDLREAVVKCLEIDGDIYDTWADDACWFTQKQLMEAARVCGVGVA